MDTPLKPTTVNVSLFIALCLAIAVGVAVYQYKWMQVKQLEMELVYKDMRNIDRFLTKARDNCFGRWSAWTALDGQPSAHFACQEEKLQSKARVKMIKAANLK